MKEMTNIDVCFKIICHIFTCAFCLIWNRMKYCDNCIYIFFFNLIWANLTFYKKWGYWLILNIVLKNENIPPFPLKAIALVLQSPLVTYISFYICSLLQPVFLNVFNLRRHSSYSTSNHLYLKQFIRTVNCVLCKLYLFRDKIKRHPFSICLSWSSR